jgi:hypothetical protein
MVPIIMQASRIFCWTIFSILFESQQHSHEMLREMSLPIEKRTIFYSLFGRQQHPPHSNADPYSQPLEKKLEDNADNCHDAFCGRLVEDGAANHPNDCCSPRDSYIHAICGIL